MATEVVLLVGSPGSGKSWVSDQLKDKFQVIEHDDFHHKDSYISALASAAMNGIKPVLGNTPFGLSEIMDRLAERRVRTTPVFIIESDPVLSKRYYERDKKIIPQGHITRQRTYRQRAEELGAFVGTSAEVLHHLKMRKECR